MIERDIVLQKGSYANYLETSSRRWAELLAASIGFAACLCSTEIWRLSTLETVSSFSSIYQQIAIIIGLICVGIYGAFSKKNWSANPWLSVFLCVLISADLFMNAAGVVNTGGLVAALHYASFTFGILLVAFWVELLYSRFPDFAMGAFVGALITTFLFQATLSMFIAPIIKISSALIPLVSCIACLIYCHLCQQNDSCYPYEIQSARISTNSLRLDFQSKIPSLAFLAIVLTCCNILFRVLHFSWLPYQTTAYNSVIIQALSAAGALVAGITVLIFLPQIKTRTGLFLSRCFIILFVLLALFLSMHASESSSSLLYLAPFNAAHKMVYVLIFCSCGFAIESRNGRILLFAILFFFYRIPSFLGAFSLILPFIDPTSYPSISAASIAAVVIVSEFFFITYTVFMKKQTKQIMAINEFPESTANEESIGVDSAVNAKQTVTTSTQETIGERLSNILMLRYGLTSREVEIVPLLVDGGNAESIGRELFISKATVKTHIHNIYAKLNVHSRDEATSLIQKLHEEII